MKPILIGEAPSKNEVTERPLEGRIGKRLAALSGLTLEAFLAHFDRVNLLHVRQDTREKGFEFDADAAALSAWRMRQTWLEPRIIICLGRRVALAFGVPLDLFTRHMLDHDFYVVPHLSGVNRWWNDPKNQLMAEQFMRRIVEETRA